VAERAVKAFEAFQQIIDGEVFGLVGGKRTCKHFGQSHPFDFAFGRVLQGSGKGVRLEKEDEIPGLFDGILPLDMQSSVSMADISFKFYRRILYCMF
jgi:hypothetical protein